MVIAREELGDIKPKKPPIEPIEEEPLEEEVLEEELIGEELKLIESLRRLYPIMFEPTSSFGFTEDEIPAMVIQQIETFATTEPKSFLKDLLEKGLDADATILLRSLGASDADIEELLAIPPIEEEHPDIESPPKPVERVVMELDGVRQLLIRTEDNSLFDRLGNWVGWFNWTDNTIFNPYKAEGLVEKTIASLTAGIGDILTTSGGVARRFGYDDIATKLSTAGSQLQQYQIPIKDRVSTADFEIGDLLDFFSEKIARAAPFGISFIPLAIGGYYAGAGIAATMGLGIIWRAIIGGLVSAGLTRPMESALEAGGSYDDAIARGKTEEEAKAEFDQVFRDNMTLVGADAFEIAIALAPTPKWVPASLINSALVRTVTIAGKVVIVGLSEGGEEVYQDLIQRRARGEEFQFDPISKEVFAIGFFMGAGMGIAGEVVSSVTNRAQGKMTPEMRRVFDDVVSDFKEQGFTQEQSELRGLDEIAKTPEGAEIIKDSVEEERIAQEPIAEVPTVPEATLPLEQVSELETRAPLDLIRKDEGAEIERLTREIQAEGITEPITIRVREDGSQIVWDGLHRLIVAQDLGLENIPVKYIGEVQMLEPKPPTPEVAKPPVEEAPVIPPEEPVSQGVILNTQGMRDVGAKEVVRPARKVLTRIGQWRELFKPTQRAEVELHEEQRAKSKMFDEWQKLLGKDKERWALVSDEINEKGSVVGLTFDEKRVVAQYRKWADEWANRKDLPQTKRIKDYMPHLFEQEATRQVKEEGGIDPVLAQILSEKETRKIIDPFLKKRLGAVGWIKDPVAAARAYEAVSLKFAYYTPMLNRIDAILADPDVPRSVKNYLSGYSKRMTGELSDIDKAGNVTIREFAEKIRGVPKIGEYFYTRMTQGNPMGMAAYHLTGLLYMNFLGFKATSAIRNLSQHTLILGEVGPKHFANGIRLRFTTEGRMALAKSLVLRSRKFAYTAGLDASFANRWTDKFREATLFAFRLADKQNVSDAFLSGYAEAKEFYPDANEQVWIDRGDEVAADTQYLYTKMNSMSFAQNAPGRVMSMLTTWTENWIELMTKWINRTPSQVYLEQQRLTGKAPPTKNWSQTYKAIALYMTLVGLSFAFDDDTRLKIKEYTGLGSLRYLAGAVGGEFPALEAVGSVADMITGFLLNDERQMKAGFAEFKSTFTPGIIRQLNNVSSGEKDYLTLLFYLDGKDFKIKNLKDEWRKDFKEYEDLSDPLVRARLYPTLSEGKARNQWREDNPLEEAKLFVIGQFTTLSSDKARQEVLRLIEEHDLDADLIDGYDKVFGIDTKLELEPFEKRLGNLEKFEIGKEAEYFTTSNYLTEVNKLIDKSGLDKIYREASPLTLLAIDSQNDWDIYFDLEEDGRALHRQLFPDVEASLYLFGRVKSFKNPKSAEMMLRLMDKYNIAPEAVPAFNENPERYDELFTPIFELKQKTFDLTTEYENFGNMEATNFIEDTEERKIARDKFKEANPEWVADMRRIEAYENDASEDIVEQWVDRGKTIDKFGAGSSQAKVWLLDNPEVHKWALDNNLLSDDGSDWNEDILRINVQLEELDPESIEYKKLNYRKNAFREEIPDELIDTYVNYYTLPPKPDDWLEGVAYYEDEWFLIENPEFYKTMIEKGIWDERDFSKVPTRAIFKKWWVYNTLTNQKDRDTYRLDNLDLDEWGVSIGIWKTTMTERRRRRRITPTERFLEDVAEIEAEFDKRMKELPILR